MTICNTIARWLSPKMANESDRYNRMLGQMITEKHWLSEFSDVSDALQRLLDSDYNHWRQTDEPHVGNLPGGISEFREMLRFRTHITPNISDSGPDAVTYVTGYKRTEAHPLARYGSAMIVAAGIYRVHWKSGGASLAAIGMLSNGDRWIAPTNWLEPSVIPKADTWGEIERLEQIDVNSIDRLKMERDRALEANARQASCINQCAFAIGPDTAGTTAGLPLAVKHLVEQLRQAREGVVSEDVVEKIIEAVNDVLADAEVDFPAGMEFGANVTIDEADLREILEGILSNPRVKSEVEDV